MSAPPSPSYSATSAPEALMMSMKPGCRGDPRMNRAVAAKLKNPHISLYDALEIGGFTYPRNVDAATMDNDRVTLGQRKNQLNRRLRLARQNMKSADKKGGNNKSNNNNNNNNKREQGSQSSSTKKVEVSGTSPLVIANSYLRQQKRGKVTSKPAAKRALSPPVKIEQSQPPTKKQCLQVVSSNTTTCPSSTAHLSKGISLTNALNQTMMTSSEYSNVTPVQGDDVASLSNLPTCNNNNTTTVLATNTAPQQDETSWWQTNVSFLNPPHEEAPKISQPVNLVVADFSSASMEHNPVILSLPPVDTNNAANKRTVSTNSFPCADVPQQQPHPQQQNLADTTHVLLQESAVVGGQLSGELRQHQQQPVAVAESATTFTADSDTLKEELGLRIFQSGLQDLYRKSMVAAGFTPQEASESSQSFHKFAFQAWKNECERLQVVLKDHTVDQQQRS